MLTITNHRLKNVDGPPNFESLRNMQTPNFSTEKTIAPTLIMIHYTASIDMESTLAHCMDAESKVSYHLLIDPTGAIAQLCPFNIRAWHAGRGAYGSLTDLNSHSIGIGLINWGELREDEQGYLCSWPNNYTKRLPGNPSFIRAAHKYDPARVRFWQCYPDAQVNACRYVCSLLWHAYSITEIIGHDDGAKGRKQDPGPAFRKLPLKDLANW